jgi:hypothetical protein
VGCARSETVTWRPRAGKATKERYPVARAASSCMDLIFISWVR